jgi:FG-GAP-like repeat
MGEKFGSSFLFKIVLNRLEPPNLLGQWSASMNNRRQQTQPPPARDLQQSRQHSSLNPASRNIRSRGIGLDITLTANGKTRTYYHERAGRLSFNADGNLDLTVTNTVSRLEGNGDGTFNAKVDYATAAGPVGLVSADFNSDGQIDLTLNSSDAKVNGCRNQ